MNRLQKDIAVSTDLLKVLIVTQRQSNPCATLQEIATPLGITRERVRQVLKKKRLPTVAYRQHYLCRQCGEDIGTTPRLFCSRLCKVIYTMIPMECSECGHIFYRPTSIAFWRLHKSKERIFCSQECKDRWLGKHNQRTRGIDGKARNV